MTPEPMVPKLVAGGNGAAPLKVPGACTENHDSGLVPLGAGVLVGLFLLFRPEDLGAANHTGSSGRTPGPARPARPLGLIHTQPEHR